MVIVLNTDKERLFLTFSYLFSTCQPFLFPHSSIPLFSVINFIFLVYKVILDHCFFCTFFRYFLVLELFVGAVLAVTLGVTISILAL